eukprot:1182651-Prorocentrum_minimum.AAC.1
MGASAPPPSSPPWKRKEAPRRADSSYSRLCYWHTCVSPRAPTNPIFSLPFRDWCPLREYSLSPSTIGASYRYILSPLPQLVPAPTNPSSTERNTHTSPIFLSSRSSKTTSSRSFCSGRNAVLPGAPAESTLSDERRGYSHDGPIGRRKHGYILTTDQSDAGSTGTFSRRINRTQEVRWRTSPVKKPREDRILQFFSGEAVCEGLNGRTPGPCRAPRSTACSPAACLCSPRAGSSVARNTACCARRVNISATAHTHT